MNTSLLRKIRIVLSLLFIIPTTFVLVDFTRILPESTINWIIYFQFVPSLIKSITLFSLITTGFILVLILTSLFGRVYCSTICPLGFFQDMINFISGKIKKKKRRFIFKKEQKILRWTLFAIPVIIFLLGSSFGISLLEPYSIYGRIAGNFFRPVLIGGNNLVSSILESYKIYWAFPYEIHAFNPVPFAITALFFGLVFYLSFTKGRLFCNTVCPVGTFLGFISKYSFYKIRIEKDDCLNCGICAKDCKANCINSDEMSVDMSRCVGCFNCVQSCPTEGIKYQFALPFKKESNPVFDESKRNFLVATGIYLASFSTLIGQVKKKIVAKKESTVPVFRQNAISPPGSTSIKRFNSRCTACHLCVSACPTQVLQPSFLEYGFLGMLQPRLDNYAGFCNFECKICSDVCPTGAILPLKIEEKKLVQLGKAKFVKENCIVETEKTDCGACSEHCPTKAVHMIPFQGKLLIPEVREEYCIGCGACEYACPTKPYKSIYIEGNVIHQVAKLNLENAGPQKQVDYKEEFPF
ncbi:MAG: 4Fe-4S binding protein [Melioribacteraceae bacterium]|nr:4Fe-4S binding protein [Melioribacteraceae bacterium]